MTTIEQTSNMQRLLDANGLSGFYPQEWSEFIGQDKAKRVLDVATKSSLLRGEPMDHVLLAAGSPGVGKTSLGLLTAAQLGTDAKIMSGRMDANAARIALSTLNDGDVLFIDEIHTLVARGKRDAEWLLHLMTDGVIMGPAGAEAQPRVTIIAATTDAGKLPDTILSRFIVQPPLTDYSEEEATLIAVGMAQRLLLPPLPWPDTDSFRRIAQASDHNPRTIRSILHHVRDLELVSPGSLSNGRSYNISEALEWMGLEPDGLDQLCMTYLRTLVEEFGGQAGAKSLADRLQEPGGLDRTERLLIKRGYLRKTSRGRVITGDGIRRITAHTTN